MPPPSLNPPSNNETSYASMSGQNGTTPGFTAGDDASLIGSHCEYTYCNQLDFLPFRCQSCNGTFCGDHRTESGHACSQAGAWAARRRFKAQARPALGADRTLRDLSTNGAVKICAFEPGCATKVGTSLTPGVHCQVCNRTYCLKHRLREDHDCANLVPVGGRPAASSSTADLLQNKTKTALEKLRLWGSARKSYLGRSLPKPKASSAQQRLAATNALKRTAKGDAKVSHPDRVYLFVEAEAETAKARIPKGEFFYSKEWVVGRVLDAAARSLQVQNINNQSADENDKLRVFHVEGGRVLEFNERVGSSLASGNTIVLLRGVKPATPDLIQV